MTIRFALATLAFLAAPALAQDAETQRELLRRDQQSDQFNLQLRQSQERLKTPPGDLRRQQEIDARQLGERQRLEGASERQLQDAGRDASEGLRPQERARMREERRPLAEPVQSPAAAPPEAPRPLPMPDGSEPDDRGSCK